LITGSVIGTGEASMVDAMSSANAMPFSNPTLTDGRSDRPLSVERRSLENRADIFRLFCKYLVGKTCPVLGKFCPTWSWLVVALGKARVELVGSSKMSRARVECGRMIKRNLRKQQNRMRRQRVDVQRSTGDKWRRLDLIVVDFHSAVLAESYFQKITQFAAIKSENASMRRHCAISRLIFCF
jgi:hypothetical protein